MLGIISNIKTNSKIELYTLRGQKFSECSLRKHNSTGIYLKRMADGKVKIYFNSRF